MNLWVLTHSNYRDFGNSVILVHFKILKIEIFAESRSSAPGGDKRYASIKVFMGNLITNNYYLNHISK